MDEIIDLRDDSPDSLVDDHVYGSKSAEFELGVGAQRIQQVDLTDDNGSVATSFNDDAVSFGTSPDPLEEPIGSSVDDENHSDSFDRLSSPSPSFEPHDSAVSFHSTQAANDLVMHSSGNGGSFDESHSPIKRAKRKNPEEIETARAAKELKKREREQLASQKLAEKQKKQDEKKAEQERKKREKLLEAEMKRYEREKTTATSKAKCESHLTTVFDVGVLSIMGLGFRGVLETTFAERNLGQQLKEESQIVPNSVIWQRRVIDGRFVDQPGTSEQVFKRFDYDETQDQIVVIVTSEQFAAMSKRRFTTSSQEESLMDYIERIKSLVLVSGEDKKLTLAVFGTSFGGIRRDTILDAVLDLQMDAKVQVRMVDSTADMARVLLCMHRAVANAEHRRRRDQSNYVLDKDRRCIKGVRAVGQGDTELISDWWGKMLMRIPRVTDEDVRTVVAAYPCPFRLMLQYETIERQDARERLLADLQVARGAGRTETHRRLGPVLSKKICLMLTSTDAEQLVTM